MQLDLFEALLSMRIILCHASTYIIAQKARMEILAPDQVSSRRSFRGIPIEFVRFRAGQRRTFQGMLEGRYNQRMESRKPPVLLHAYLLLSAMLCDQETRFVGQSGLSARVAQIVVSTSDDCNSDLSRTLWNDSFLHFPRMLDWNRETVVLWMCCSDLVQLTQEATQRMDLTNPHNELRACVG
jgi:hypothetical protein